ncbi:MAG: FAD-binding oxidoreductase [Ignavibacteriales bacterium]
MALSKEIYQAFEDVVGKNNISGDAAVLESYRVVPSQSSDHRGPFFQKTPLPQAVILPETTEEVQLIIKLCNKYGIQFKASSTFWSVMGYIGSDCAVQIDTRRMRKFEIDSKNMLAIIEPYVIGATLQAEAMKVGLTLNIPGVGCSSSVLASTSGWVGFGPTSISMGAATENLLAAEWVLPDGEILRTGSLGAGSGWFCGEGPGISTRGILRGKLGTAGSFGICTKMAVRLHPWPGPTYIPTRGTIPAYKACLPDNFKAYTLCFPTWDAYAEAVNLFHQNDLLFLGHRQFTMFGRDIKTAMITILNDPDKQLADIPVLCEDPYLKEQNEKMKIDIQIIIAGMTKRDTEYKDKALDKILEMTGGWKSELMLDKDLTDYVLLYLIRMGHKNLNFVMCGGYEGNFGLSGNVFVSASVMEEASALKKKWEDDTNYIAKVGGDSDMGSICTMGGGGTTGWEFFTHFDSYDKESVKGTGDFFNATQDWMAMKGLGLDMGKWNQDCRRPDGYSYSQEEHDELFCKLPQPLVVLYQYKVREEFNPGNLCGSYYRTLSTKKYEEIAKGE